MDKALKALEDAFPNMPELVEPEEASEPFPEPWAQYYAGAKVRVESKRLARAIVALPAPYDTERPAHVTSLAGGNNLVQGLAAGRDKRAT